MVKIPKQLIHSTDIEDSSSWPNLQFHQGNKRSLIPSFCAYECLHSKIPSNAGQWTSGNATGRMEITPIFRLPEALRKPQWEPKYSAEHADVIHIRDSCDRKAFRSNFKITFGTLTRKGFAPGYKEDNQDSLLCHQTFLSPSSCLIGVFDGHGLSGHKVSRFVRDNLPHGLSNLLHKGWAVDEALRSSFTQVNERMETQPEFRGSGCQGCSGSVCGGCSPTCGFDAYNSGSTAVVTYLKDGVLTTAWTGDSRAVLGVQQLMHANVTTATTELPAVRFNSGSRSSFAASASSAPQNFSNALKTASSASQALSARPTSAGSSPLSDVPEAVGSASVDSDRGSQSSVCYKAVELSLDHKPDRPDERRRVLLSGGRVNRTYSSTTGKPNGPYRVWHRDRDYPGLAMSRAFGDLSARSAGIICIPEISQVDLNSQSAVPLLTPQAGSNQQPNGRVSPSSRTCSTGSHGMTADKTSSGTSDHGRGNGRTAVIFRGSLERSSNMGTMVDGGATSAAGHSGSSVSSSSGSKGSAGGSNTHRQRYFLVLASDGVWEFMSNQEVVDLVGSKLKWGATCCGVCDLGCRGGAERVVRQLERNENGWGESHRLKPASTSLLIHGSSASTSSQSQVHQSDLRAGLSSRLFPKSSGSSQSPSHSCGVVAACEAVAAESVSRWMSEYKGQYIDDITIVVAQLEQLEQ
ncbi:hypothetical protein CEUSTIGMA_g6377.t1 [Chlamydomonas eustigma]|uniref:protein-serine/threonine phosphatase n=1 Tax=Chlamydomonas eustigma TaxID=1157962 RepID=A0A250X791_9CHLO|nr:hypothetical protein CEUSTIGMA_g6377.t1 [Chlamydomonas eustigma]|eukprot:GAX78937.1 hypothetical protein CEUSTIGMA_g6377.t1 [Chlamydomonas eustigma]